MATVNFGFNDLLLPMSTSIGYMGGFPAAPQVFLDLAKNEWFQWAMVFNLIYQGGSGQRVDLALVTTVITYILVKLLDGAFVSGLGACPAPAPPAEA